MSQWVVEKPNIQKYSNTRTFYLKEGEAKKKFDLIWCHLACTVGQNMELNSETENSIKFFRLFIKVAPFSVSTLRISQALR